MQELTLTTRLGRDGLPISASCDGMIAASAERVWSVLEDVERFAGRVPMISKVRRSGDMVDVDLKFKIALFSVTFRFGARAEIDRGKRLELIGTSGEPKDIRLTMEVEPAGEHARLRTHTSFDLYSLGWVTKYFLKHHPEIQCGVFPGVAIALHTFLGRAATGQ